jgi:YndJ-like protein
MLWVSIFCFTESTYSKPDWHVRVLELAALVWLPIGVSILSEKAGFNFPSAVKNSILVAAVCLVIALEFNFENHAFFTIPYVFLTFSLAASSIENWILSPRRLSHTTLSVSLMMLPVASLWAASHCFDYQLINFSREIVTLTAVHFHYAGFLFILLCGIALQQHDNSLIRWACRLAIAAVPMTALGITASQLSGNYVMEMLSAVCVALAGYCCAIAYVRMAFSTKKTMEIMLSFSFAAVLFFSMSLAVLYAIRPFYLLDWLTIPYMKAIHGTCNGILVPSLGLLMAVKNSDDNRVVV